MMLDQFSILPRIPDHSPGSSGTPAPSPQLASTIPNLFIFGDSFSDQGNLFKLTHSLIPPNPPYFEGRFSNGLIWVDYFAAQLGIPQDAITNYAISGAKTGRENIGKFGTLPGLLDEVDTYATRVTDHGANSEDLFIIWAGSTDFVEFKENPTSDAAATFAQTAAVNIATAVTELINLGAEKIVVLNVMDFGLIPCARQLNLSEPATTLAVFFKYALRQAIASLKHYYSIDITEVDLFSLSRRIAETPEDFGFSNLADPLIKQIAPAHPEQYLWWDEVHPTTQAHEWIADAIALSIQDFFPSFRGQHHE
jgi:phospholipase/lecithinase/hemolysin